MVEIINCPSCGGSGCESCENKGTVIRDESGKLYVNTIENNSGGRKRNKSSMGYNLFAKLFAEPHDFFWAIEKKK